jgi:hypothetical protein
MTVSVRRRHLLRQTRRWRAPPHRDAKAPLLAIASLAQILSADVYSALLQAERQISATH